MSDAIVEEPDLPPPSLDGVALDRLRELDPDGRHGVLARVLTAFETSLARMLVQLQSESARGDVEVVLSIAHTLKSSSASVGALALARACAEVERRLRESGRESGREGGHDGGPEGGHEDVRADARRLAGEAQRALLSVGAMLRT